MTDWQQDRLSARPPLSGVKLVALSCTGGCFFFSVFRENPNLQESDDRGALLDKLQDGVLLQSRRATSYYGGPIKLCFWK